MNNNKEIKAVKTIDPMLIIIGIVCVAAFAPGSYRVVPLKEL